jgi:nitrogen regulatory protein PII
VKLIVAYVREKCAASIVRELHNAEIGGITAYPVRGMSGEVTPFFYSKRPFELAHLPDAVKFEVVCPEESVDRIVNLLAQAARTGEPGDGIVAVQNVERVVRISNMKQAPRASSKRREPV